MFNSIKGSGKLGSTLIEKHQAGPRDKGESGVFICLQSQHMEELAKVPREFCWFGYGFKIVLFYFIFGVHIPALRMGTQFVPRDVSLPLASHPV
jgi:hypothetical protein